MAKTTKKAPKVWSVEPISVADGFLYAAYKLKDTLKPDTAGNRIVQGGLWSTKKEAQLVADRLNKEAE